jgi:hypothetical protein
MQLSTIRTGRHRNADLQVNLQVWLNACIDERIESLSPDKLRGIVTLKVWAGVT